ncbi:STAS domain-containing protein [Aureimonas jatrophae]|jgi:anti-anti-sigma regulatory factor|uniref:STAS domain-containing protein n=1 Tax=Aureimonas jatrophae TaxID=1166073 RepID=A0A1H0CTZ4_9HYPH|nr:STAS domain-containing protein [Aureimonas jatrophae]MBB3951647.1 anti-anti-sigma regulatory factor [Aureimonas jatrophae]SDN61356.1 STAS domain-containing protein [Aureimonas jatrophae]
MSSPSVLTLHGAHDLSTSVATHAAMLEASAAGSLRLDLSGVESADVSFVQLVLALRAGLEARGDTLECLTSPAVVEAFSRCGADLPAN